MEEAKQDCIDWIMNFVEQPHEFYDFKFPPCPFAKKVRIDNDLIIQSHHQGSLINFTKAQIDVWLESNKTVMVIFSDIKYNFWELQGPESQRNLWKNNVLRAPGLFFGFQC